MLRLLHRPRIQLLLVHTRGQGSSLNKATMNRQESMKNTKHNYKNDPQKKHISKKEGKDQESIQSSTTPDPGYQLESDNVTIRHHKREPRGPPFPSR